MFAEFALRAHRVCDRLLEKAAFFLSISCAQGKHSKHSLAGGAVVIIFPGVGPPAL